MRLNSHTVQSVFSVCLWIAKELSSLEVGSKDANLGPVQGIVSLTSSLRVISLTVLADSIHNILIFFAEKM